MLHFVTLSHSLELLDSVGFRYLAAYDGLVFLGKFLHLCLNLREVILADYGTLWRHNVIEESVFHSRSEAELDARVKFLKSFS